MNEAPLAAGDERTLDELRHDLVPAIAASVAFEGWSDAALAQACAAQGVNPAVGRLAFPGGAMDMIAGWTVRIDADMEAHFAAGSLEAMKVREKIRALVLFRLERVAGEKEAVRRAMSIMALPVNVMRTGRLAWSSADRMWRLAGDTATDYNHYTKRALLAGLYGATLAVFVEDESAGQAETRAFLDRRIEDVMRIGKATGRLTREREGFDFVRFLGRLRYPERPGTGR